MFIRSSLAVVTLVAFSSAFASTAFSVEPKSPPKAPGLGDPGKLTALEIIAGVGDKVELRGADDRLQIVVSGVYDSGQFRDFTRKVKYQVKPEGIVNVDERQSDHCGRN